LITVDDDGRGLDALYDPPDSDDASKKEPASRANGSADGRGLDNLLQRLQGLYGDDASLVLSSAPIGGVRVAIRIPKRIPTSDTLRGTGVVLPS